MYVSKYNEIQSNYYHENELGIELKNPRNSRFQIDINKFVCTLNSLGVSIMWASYSLHPLSKIP